MQVISSRRHDPVGADADIFAESISILMSLKTVTVATFDTIGEAELARLRLRDAGIPCLITGRGQSGLPRAMFHANAAHIRVQVVETNAKAARAVLAEG